MAGRVMDIFTDNYLKQLKRPELLNEGPDTAFGANMVRGSENINPWAGRDQDNAKYGQFAQRQPSTTYGAGGPAVSPLAPKTGTPFASLLAPGTAPASNWLATSGWERLKGIFGGGTPTPTPQNITNPLAEMGGGYARMAGLPISGEPFEDYTKAFADIAKSGVEDVTPSFEPTTAPLSIVPMGLQALTGSKTVGNVADAGIGVGTAAAQGFANPISDLFALWKLAKLGMGLF